MCGLYYNSIISLISIISFYFLFSTIRNGRSALALLVWIRVISLIFSLPPGDQEDEEQKSKGTSWGNVRSRSGHRFHAPFPDGSGIGPVAASASPATASSRSPIAPGSTSSSVLGVVSYEQYGCRSLSFISMLLAHANHWLDHMVGAGRHGCNRRECEENN
jgi:hypothetical protein